VDRRIVLKTLTGPQAGLRRIVGTERQLLTEGGLQTLPQQVEDVSFSTHDAPARLLISRSRYHLYSEVLPERVTPHDSSGI
jgi:hypothetical protein